MLRPLIGISGNYFDTRPDPLRSGVNDAYIRAVTDAGGTPFILPYTDDTEAVENMIAHLDGLLLSGGKISILPATVKTYYRNADP